MCIDKTSRRVRLPALPAQEFATRLYVKEHLHSFPSAALALDWPTWKRVVGGKRDYSTTDQSGKSLYSRMRVRTEWQLMNRFKMLHFQISEMIRAEENRNAAVANRIWVLFFRWANSAKCKQTATRPRPASKRLRIH